MWWREFSGNFKPEWTVGPERDWAQTHHTVLRGLEGNARDPDPLHFDQHFEVLL
eukprot:m.252663 g.252663  ORF g.252663 m.252663 type:complete len:54 (+) comp15918_c0_seq6:171-332(+)